MGLGLHGSLAATMTAMAPVLVFVVPGHVTALLPSVEEKCVRVLPLKWPIARGNSSFISLLKLTRNLFYPHTEFKMRVIPKNHALKVLDDLHVQEPYSAEE